MDDSVSPTIEKIKRQVQDNEIRLREKREFNSAVLSINRAIHDNLKLIDKFTKEHQNLLTITDKLQHELTMETIRQKALDDIVNDCRKEIEDLQKSCVRGISTVWEKRSLLFKSVQTISDECDIWALLMKPACEIKATTTHPVKTENIDYDESKLKAVIERRSKAVALRNFLLSEPDAGEEFVRLGTI